MRDYRSDVAKDPDDPTIKFDNHLKQIKLFALDTTYVGLMWMWWLTGVVFSILPIYLANESERPVLIQGLQINARLFILATLVIVGGKLVQETLLAFLVPGWGRSGFSPQQIRALRHAANRLIKKREEEVGINRFGSGS